MSARSAGAAIGEPTIGVEVLLRTARFDMTGQSLGYDLADTGGTISPGLAKRIDRFARRILASGGFDVASWKASIYTMDADAPSSERSYTAEYVNDKGGMLGVAGIETRRGHPFLHHEVNADIGR